MGSVKQRLQQSDALVRIVRSTRTARLSARRRARDRAIDEYVRANRTRKLQLGAGSNIRQGWLNTDVYDERKQGEVVYLNARRRFPLEDASFDYVYSEHMLEHFTYADALRCLEECRRVLRPGGRIRVATPSLDRIVGLYAQDDDLARRYVKWSIDAFIPSANAYLPGFTINNMVRNWGHKFIFDRQTLGHALESAGFVDVEEYPVGKSDRAELADLESHGDMIPPEFNAFETLVVEATRP